MDKYSFLDNKSRLDLLSEGTIKKIEDSYTVAEEVRDSVNNFVERGVLIDKPQRINEMSLTMTETERGEATAILNKFLQNVNNLAFQDFLNLTSAYANSTIAPTRIDPKEAKRQAGY